MAEWRKKWEVLHHYNSLATVYDVQYSEEQSAKMKAALSSISLIEDSLVLDVGCGTGILFEHLSNRVKLLVGLDTSSRILGEAKRRAKRFSNVAILRADADSIPFPNETFDMVFAITVLQNTPNPLLTLQEMKRVSKHRSVIAVTGLKKEFTQESFMKLLSKAKLEISVMKTNDQLKGYVAICKKLSAFRKKGAKN